MSNLLTIPAELVEKIVGSLVEVDDGAPVVGHNALMVDPYAWINANQAEDRRQSSKLRDLRNLRL